MGPLMIDVQGTSLTEEDQELLAHPLVGGLILFTRNYEAPEQLIELTQQIRQDTSKDFLIAVDHEGGRVQRFRSEFSRIPAMGTLSQLSENNQEQAKTWCFYAGQLMAIEVLAVGIDISFAPVLDVNGISEVIGDRAFHSSPDTVQLLATAFIKGMNSVGMKATGKHFPGHGSVQEDSHVAMPVDSRSASDIFQFDLQPFQQLIKNKLISAVMPAHIIFPCVDQQAVGFSEVWLQQILRDQLGFDGVIFSDDLSMAGASVAGGCVERSEAAQAAGCDMLLMCNDREATIKVIDQANLNINEQSQHRLQKMLSHHSTFFNDMTFKNNTVWQQAFQQIEKINKKIAY